jgi:hypothetical protein
MAEASQRRPGFGVSKSPVHSDFYNPLTIFPLHANKGFTQPGLIGGVKVNQNMAADTGLRIAFNLDQILDGRNPIALNAETTSTYSRTNDSLADQLRENITGAFAVESSRFVTRTSTQISSEGGSGGIRGKTGTRKASGIREGIGAEPPGSPSLVIEIDPAQRRFRRMDFRLQAANRSPIGRLHELSTPTRTSEASSCFTPSTFRAASNPARIVFTVTADRSSKAKTSPIMVWIRSLAIRADNWSPAAKEIRAGSPCLLFAMWK